MKLFSDHTIENYENLTLVNILNLQTLNPTTQPTSMNSSNQIFQNISTSTYGSTLMQTTILTDNSNATKIQSYEPTYKPNYKPTNNPTIEPTIFPNAIPSNQPTIKPTAHLTQESLNKTKNEVTLSSIEDVKLSYLISTYGNIVNDLSSHRIKKCHYFPSHSRIDYYDNKYDYIQPIVQKVTMSFSYIPVYVYSPCMSTYNLGNSLGNYFYELTCAIATGTNLIIGNKLSDQPNMPLAADFKGRKPSISKSKILDMHRMDFFDYLPDIVDTNYICDSSSNTQYIRLVSKSIPNRLLEYKYFSENNIQFISYNTSYQRNISTIKFSNQYTKQSSKEKLQRLCTCEKYCWTIKYPWVNYSSLIGKILNEAIDFHMNNFIKYVSNQTIVNPDIDFSNHVSSISLPIIPDIAIHYRCGDNIPSDTYGFLPFTTISELIKFSNISVNYIYVLSDPPDRVRVFGDPNRFSLNCDNILKQLHEKLIEKFSTSVVVVKRNDDPLLDFARLSKAKLTICSVSTFCIWPAIANNQLIYFPISKLVAESNNLKNMDDLHVLNVPNTGIKLFNNIDNIDGLPPYFSSNFYWIISPLIITKFQADSPMKFILDSLSRNY